MTIVLLNGRPVILDEDGNGMDPAKGIRAIRRFKGWSVHDMGTACGVSPRTVEGWEQGMRTPSASALLALRAHL